MENWTPFGYVGIAIENGHRNSESSYYSNGMLIFHSYQGISNIMYIYIYIYIYQYLLVVFINDLIYDVVFDILIFPVMGTIFSHIYDTMVTVMIVMNHL